MEQANKIFDNIAFTKEIDDYGFRFDPVVGHTYYIYERENEERFVSLIAPANGEVDTILITYIQ